MTHELHFPILTQLGLNESEALVYEIMLELGPNPATSLIKPSGLGRGNLYNVLTSLKEKGLITEKVGKKTVFTASDPETLRILAKGKLSSMQEILNQLDATMPKLKSNYQLITKKPTFRVFEGIEGIKSIYLETLAQDQPIFALVGPDDPHPELYSWLTKTYTKKRVLAKIHATVIASGDTKAKKYEKESEESLRSVTLIDDNVYPFSGEVDVFGQKIAFISYKSDELIGIIFESPALAETMRSTIKALSKFAPKSD